MTKIELSLLVGGPHANLIREMAEKCALDARIQAVWVGGSLASGMGDAFSDVDFRIAVAPSKVDEWASPDWEQYLPVLPCDGTLMRFGEQALLHHLVLNDEMGTIVDFFVQDTERDNFEPNVVVLFCRNQAFGERLDNFARPASRLTKQIEGESVRQFLVDYWITTHKQLKALAREYDLSPFVGLYFERVALLRAWYMREMGVDLVARPSLHMLGVLHAGLKDKLNEEQHKIVGLPSRTPAETVAAIEAIRAEMAEVGRWLAETHGFAYPHELEEVVLAVWDKDKAEASQR